MKLLAIATVFGLALIVAVGLIFGHDVSDKIGLPIEMALLTWLILLIIKSKPE